MDKVDLKSLSEDKLRSFMAGRGLPAYRAEQLLHWIYEKKAVSINQITELSKSLRSELNKCSYISNLELADRRKSSDGTEKFLFGLEDGNRIESVLIHDDKRLTLCISSQVGCAMECRFCLTGKDGLKRNLKAHEIADQVISAQRLSPRRVTNIVLMGMGEPLNNLNEVSEALWRITNLIKFSPRKVTVSTSGLADKMLDFSAKAPLVNLAVSLNATTDEQRDYIMPINNRFSIKELIEACRRYPLKRRQRVTFEYVMMAGFNDSGEDARRLISIVRQVPSKVNLIPVNEYDGSEFKRPSDSRMLEFQGVLIAAGITAFIRKSKGSDILAACGQLSVAVKTYSS